VERIFPAARGRRGGTGEHQVGKRLPLKPRVRGRIVLLKRWLRVGRRDVQERASGDGGVMPLIRITITLCERGGETRSVF